MDYTDQHFLENFKGFIRVSDLAVLYFANYSRPDAAVRMFRKRIRASKNLYDKLLATDYDEKETYIVPKHIKLIVEAFGSPEAYKRKYTDHPSEASTGNR